MNTIYITSIYKRSFIMAFNFFYFLVTSPKTQNIHILLVWMKIVLHSGLSNMTN